MEKDCISVSERKARVKLKVKQKQKRSQIRKNILSATGVISTLTGILIAYNIGYSNIDLTRGIIGLLLMTVTSMFCITEAAN